MGKNREGQCNEMTMDMEQQTFCVLKPGHEGPHDDGAIVWPYQELQIPCESYSPLNHHRCNLPNGHEGAHMAVDGIAWAVGEEAKPRAYWRFEHALSSNLQLMRSPEATEHLWRAVQEIQCFIQGQQNTPTGLWGVPAGASQLMAMQNEIHSLRISLDKVTKERDDARKAFDERDVLCCEQLRELEEVEKVVKELTDKDKSMDYLATLHSFEMGTPSAVSGTLMGMRIAAERMAKALEYPNFGADGEENSHLPKLDDFIKNGEFTAHTRSAWVDTLNFAECYVRVGLRDIAGALRKTINLANISARTPGQKAFTNLVHYLRDNYLDCYIYVENVQTERFGDHLLRVGFIHDDAHFGCYYRPAHQP